VCYETTTHQNIAFFSFLSSLSSSLDDGDDKKKIHVMFWSVVVSRQTYTKDEKHFYALGSTSCGFAGLVQWGLPAAGTCSVFTIFIIVRLLFNLKVAIVTNLVPSGQSRHMVMT